MLKINSIGFKFIRLNRYSFFWRKQKVEENQENQQEQNKPNQDKWQGKELYLKEIQQQREQFEKEMREEKKIEQTIEQREKREYEVKYGKVDFAKVMIDNINIRMSDNFKHPEQLFNFLQNLRVRLNEENLINCVTSFLQLANLITNEDLSRPEFLEFLNILANQAGIISSIENFTLVFQFLDIYCVESQNPIWEAMEILLLKRLNQIDIQHLSQIFSHLGNQREGSDVLWDSCENQIQTILKNEKEKKAYYGIKFELAYWKVRRGTKLFIQGLNKQIYESIKQGEQLPINSLIQLASIQSSLLDQKVPTIPEKIVELFENIEKQLGEKIMEMNFEQICLTSQGFGFKFGSQKFREQLENQGLIDIFLIQFIVLKQKNFDLEELKLIINGFLMNYRGSRHLCMKIKDMIVDSCDNFDSIYIANIAKAYYMIEILDDNDIFYHKLERISKIQTNEYFQQVVDRLKDVKKIKIEEIYEIAKSYIITRIGSRELYKLMEIVIKYRFDEIKDNIQILGSLHQLYKESGLCSPELIKQFQLNL